MHLSLFFFGVPCSQFFFERHGLPLLCVPSILRLAPLPCTSFISINETRPQRWGGGAPGPTAASGAAAAGSFPVAVRRWRSRSRADSFSPVAEDGGGSVGLGASFWSGDSGERRVTEGRHAILPETGPNAVAPPPFKLCSLARRCKNESLAFFSPSFSAKRSPAFSDATGKTEDQSQNSKRQFFLFGFGLKGTQSLAQPLEDNPAAPVSALGSGKPCPALMLSSRARRCFIFSVGSSPDSTSRLSGNNGRLPARFFEKNMKILFKKK